jgi:hypothetical protein
MIDRIEPEHAGQRPVNGAEVVPGTYKRRA